MDYGKYYRVCIDVDDDNELLDILPEIEAYAEKHPKFKLDFVEKCRDVLFDTNQLPMAMYNALVNTYYKFKMDEYLDIGR